MKRIVCLGGNILGATANCGAAEKGGLGMGKSNEQEGGRGGDFSRCHERKASHLLEVRELCSRRRSGVVSREREKTEGGENGVSFRTRRAAEMGSGMNVRGT